MKKYEIIIVGAGPSGLAAAYELYRNGITNILVIDKNSKPGGLARTEIFENNRFDIGPHRFFTKNKEINQLWQEILGNDFLPIARLTRIFYKNKLFNYPLKPLNALTNLGVKESIGSVLSYLKSKISNGKKCFPVLDCVDKIERFQKIVSQWLASNWKDGNEINKRR